MSISITNGRSQGAGHKTNSPASRTAAVLNGLVGRIRTALETGRMQAELETLDDRMLADIGVYRNGKVLTVMRPGEDDGRFPEVG